VTYPDLTVASLLNELFIPVQVNIEKALDLVKKYRPIWTPNLNFLDDQGEQFYHQEGWLPAGEYAAMLMNCRGHYFIRKKRYADAIPEFQEVLDKYPISSFAPEAAYYLAVSKYMSTHKAEELIGGWDKLQHVSRHHVGGPVEHSVAPRQGVWRGIRL
jgi:hypothetical protein